MPNDWTPRPPYPFDSFGKVNTPSGRARRQLLKAAFGALVVAAAGYLSWLELFKGPKRQITAGGKTDDGSVANTDSIAIGSVAKLMQSPAPSLVTINGQQAFVEFTGGKPCVLNATCPHQGCNVIWQADGSKFVCPCHNSQFARDGSLLQGPSKQPLAQIPIVVKNGLIYAEA